MRLIGFIFFLFGATSVATAGSPYHAYLLQQVNERPISTQLILPVKPVSIARYQIPTGAVFCRLEDKLTRATKVWIKIGVQ